MNEKPKRRLPAKEKQINEITSNDIRVRVIATVVDVSENSIVVDDGTGKLEIGFENPDVRIGQLVKVIVRIFPTGDGFEAKGECLQVLNGFDIKLYKQVRDIIKNIGVVRDV
jgi:hypothetical protein